MGQILANPEKFGKSVRYPGERKNSNNSIELDSFSPIAHPQDAELAAVRAQHDERPRNLSRLPADTSIPRKTKYRRRRPFSSGDEIRMRRLVRTTKVADVEPTQVGLPGLPTDVILNIAHSLPPSGVLSLSYTCRSLRSEIGVSIEEFLGEKDNKSQLSKSTFGTKFPYWTGTTERDFKWSLPTMTSNVHHSERLELLCMLDRDGKLPPSKAVCSSCADTHVRSLFCNEALAQPSNERRCVNSAGRIWICPHWFLDHNPMTTSNKESQASHSSGKKCIPVLAIRYELAVHYERVEPTVIFYSPRCKRFWVGCSNDPDCRSPPPEVREPPPPNGGPAHTHMNVIQGGKCKSCGTGIRFSINPDADGRDTLSLVIRRNVKGSPGCMNPEWIGQMNDPVEFEELERQWRNIPDGEAAMVRERSLSMA